MKAKRGKTILEWMKYKRWMKWLNGGSIDIWNERKMISEQKTDENMWICYIEWKEAEKKNKNKKKVKEEGKKKKFEFGKMIESFYLPKEQES